MDQFFNKALVFADCHFGRSADSSVANQDNLDCLTWMIDRARSWGAETCIFLGDYFHNRSTIGVSSLDFALDGLERLSAAGFAKTVMLLGNHDIARRQSRAVSSLNFARHLPNIHLIHHPVTSGNVTLLPWLVGEEHHMLPHLKSRYVFGHLETVGAMMNAKIPCTGGEHAVQPDTFGSQERVFSGHFHARQTLKNITYIGNTMGHDFSDANDAARGAMLLQWGHDPMFETWPEQPLYTTASLSMLLNDLDVLRPKMSLRATVDIELRYDEAHALRDTLVNSYGLRKLELLNLAEPDSQTSGDTTLHTVDEIVIDGLRNIVSTGLSGARLIELFVSLPRL